MPIVPTKKVADVEQRLPRPTYLTVQATPEAFGAARARALSQLGTAVQGVGEDVHEINQRLIEEDRARQTQRQATDFDTAVNDLLYGDEGYFRKQGQDAVDAIEPTRTQLNDLIKSQSLAIKDEEVRTRFLQYAQSAYRSKLGPIARHNITEGRKATLATADVRKGNAIENAIANRNDPQALAGAIDEGYAAIEIAASVNGLPAEVIEAQKQEFESALHMRVIDSFGEDYNVEGANAYFGMVRDRLDPELLDDAKRKIDSFDAARVAEQNRRRAVVENQRKEYKRTVGNRFVEKLATNELTPSEIIASDLDPEDKLKWIKLSQQNALGQTHTNPDTFNDLFRRINLPDGDPDKITDPDDLNDFVGNGLTFEDMNKLRGEFTDRDKPEVKALSELRKSFLRMAHGTLSGTNDLLNIKDPEGEAKYQQWLSWFLTEEQKARESGKLTADYYNPARQDIYLGRTLESFKSDEGPSIKSQVDALDDEPSDTPQPKSEAKPPVIRDRAAYDKLSSGTVYIGPDGKKRRKQ